MKSKIQKKEKSMAEPIFIPLKNYIIYSEDEIKKRSKDFYELVKKRRTIRSFSKEKVRKKAILPLKFKMPRSILKI